MKKGLIGTLLVALGAGGGFYVGYHIAKKKYENLADIEVESVKKELKEYYETPKKEKKDIPGTPGKKPSVITSGGVAPTRENDIVKQNKEYHDYAAKYAPENDTRIPGTPGSEIGREGTGYPPVGSNRPYIIDEEEYASTEYEVRTLLYWADKVLSDDEHNVIHDVEKIVGWDNLTQFSVQTEIDVIYIQDDELGMVYEVLKEEREYYKGNNQ